MNSRFAALASLTQDRYKACCPALESERYALSMSFKRMQPTKDSEAGYFNLFGSCKGIAIYALLALTLTCGLLGFDDQSAISLLVFPLAVGLAVLAGLLFQMAGAMVSFAIVLSISGYGYFTGVDFFEPMVGEQALFFFVGLSLLVGVFSLVGALAVGYCQRTAEVAVHRQNLLYQVFDALPIGIWVRARDGRSLFVNERWASYSPRSIEEILDADSTEPPVDLGAEWNRNISEVLVADDFVVRYQSIELTDNAGCLSNMTLLTLRVMIDQENGFGTLSLLVDETTFGIYEEKIRKSEQNFYWALNNARMGFWDKYVKTKELRCDDSWYHLMDAERLVGESPLQVWETHVHPDDHSRVRDLYRDYYRNGEGSLRIDYRVRKGDQGYIWVQDSVQVTEYDVDGTPLRVMGTMQDVTDQKQAELELKQAKERSEAGNKAKSQFIATISHEIRTPLNAIIGLSSFLAEGELEGEQLDLAQTINSSGRSLLLLVNDILDFSKIEAGRLDLEVQEFPLLLCFEDCVKLFKLRASEKNVAITLNLSKELPEFAAGDMQRLRQIVQNLLSNALKFTEIGDINVSVRPVILSEIDEAYRPDPLEPIGYLDQPDRDYLEVRIQDTGIGIPTDRQHVLFEAFSQVDSSTTRKYGGTGLGLVICKRLVDAMGGRIWVESEEGKGATFSFVVRTKLIGENSEIAGLTKTPFDPVERIAEAHPCDILVVGPEDETRALIVSCRRLGYAPHSTEDYDLSGSKYRRRHYNIMFIWMGDELKALELARKISATAQMLKPESIVGYAPADQKVSKDRCRLSGMHEVMQQKPRPQSVREIILNVLGSLD
ncbi:MAG: PAS domain S-box-containing protein [Candidatus Azotimanducaceae bacterium]